MNIENIDAFLDLPKEKQRKIIVKMLKQAENPSITGMDTRERITHYSPCFTWEALNIYKAMIEIGKSGYKYTMEDF